MWCLAGEVRACVICGTFFHIWPSQLSRPGYKNLYCSQTCAGVVRGQRQLGKKMHPGHGANVSAGKKGRPIPALRKPPSRVFDCLGCGALVTCSNSEPMKRRESRRFCSRDCYYGWARAHPEAHRHYRGGSKISSLYGPRWNQVRQAIRRRDGHTCRDCGVQRKRPALDVHHIVPRRTFNGDWDAANRPENLVTLCRPCHIKREIALDSFKEWRALD